MILPLGSAITLGTGAAKAAYIRLRDRVRRDMTAITNATGGWGVHQIFGDVDTRRNVATQLDTC